MEHENKNDPDSKNLQGSALKSSPPPSGEMENKDSQSNRSGSNETETNVDSALASHDDLHVVGSVLCSGDNNSSGRGSGTGTGSGLCSSGIGSESQTSDLPVGSTDASRVAPVSLCGTTTAVKPEVNPLVDCNLSVTVTTTDSGFQSNVDQSLHLPECGNSTCACERLFMDSEVDDGGLDGAQKIGVDASTAQERKRPAIHKLHYSPFKKRKKSELWYYDKGGSGFSLAVSLADGIVIHVTDSIIQVLGYPKDFWPGQMFMNFIHKKDLIVFNNKLSECNMSTAIDKSGEAKNGSFYCRLRTFTGLKNSFSLGIMSAYRPFYIKYRVKNVILQGKDVSPEEILPRKCMTMIAQPLKSPYRDGSLVDGKFRFCTQQSVFGNLEYIDTNGICVLGFLPQDIIGTSLFSRWNEDDFSKAIPMFQQLVEQEGVCMSDNYRISTNNGHYITIQTEWRLIMNKWSKSVEVVEGYHRLIDAPSNINVFSGKAREESERHQRLSLQVQNTVKEILVSYKASMDSSDCASTSNKKTSSFQISETSGSEDSNKDYKSASATAPSLEKPTPETSQSESVGAAGPSLQPAPNFCQSYASYQQLNYAQNIRRFLQSRPKMYCTDKVIKRAGSTSDGEDIVVVAPPFHVGSSRSAVVHVSEHLSLNEEDNAIDHEAMVHDPDDATVNEQDSGTKDGSGSRNGSKGNSDDHGETLSKRPHSILTQDIMKIHNSLQEQMYLQQMNRSMGKDAVHPLVAVPYPLAVVPHPQAIVQEAPEMETGNFRQRLIEKVKPILIEHNLAAAAASADVTEGDNENDVPVSSASVANPSVMLVDDIKRRENILSASAPRTPCPASTASSAASHASVCRTMSSASVASVSRTLSTASTESISHPMRSPSAEASKLFYSVPGQHPANNAYSTYSIQHLPFHYNVSFGNYPILSMNVPTPLPFVTTPTQALHPALQSEPLGTLYGVFPSSRKEASTQTPPAVVHVKSKRNSFSEDVAIDRVSSLDSEGVETDSSCSASFSVSLSSKESSKGTSMKREIRPAFWLEGLDREDLMEHTMSLDSSHALRETEEKLQEYRQMDGLKNQLQEMVIDINKEKKIQHFQSMLYLDDDIARIEFDGTGRGVDFTFKPPSKPSLELEKHPKRVEDESSLKRPPVPRCRFQSKAKSCGRDSKRKYKSKRSSVTVSVADKRISLEQERRTPLTEIDLLNSIVCRVHINFPVQNIDDAEFPWHCACDKQNAIAIAAHESEKQKALEDNDYLKAKFETILERDRRLLKTFVQPLAILEQMSEGGIERLPGVSYDAEAAKGPSADEEFFETID